jgi:hypothetical protein
MTSNNNNNYNKHYITNNTTTKTPMILTLENVLTSLAGRERKNGESNGFFNKQLNANKAGTQSFNTLYVSDPLRCDYLHCGSLSNIGSKFSYSNPTYDK